MSPSLQIQKARPQRTKYAAEGHTELFTATPPRQCLEGLSPGHAAMNAGAEGTWTRMGTKCLALDRKALVIPA